jgi:hypothetical protein
VNQLKKCKKKTFTLIGGIIAQQSNNAQLLKFEIQNGVIQKNQD